MARNDKLARLEEAVRTQAASLEPAQQNFVMAQFDHYRWNEERIADLEQDLEGGVVDDEGFHNYDAEGKLLYIVGEGTKDIGLAAGNTLLTRAIIRSDIMDEIEDAGAAVANAEAMAYRVVDTDD